MRILVVEDEKDLSRVIVKKLKKEHFSVDVCYDGEMALDYMECAEYDAVILDIMMPKVDGLQVLKTMRDRQDKTPVLLLTARDSISDRVKGLNEGADDYLVKPFAFDELLARLRVLIRRTTDHISNCYTLANLTVDCDKRTVFRDDNEIALSSKEFSVLEYMIKNKGVVLTRDKIEQHIWNYDYSGSSNVVDVYIRYLRKKIDENYSPKLIHTLRGTGYVMKEER